MQDAAFDVHLGQLEAAGLRHAQAVTEHQQKQTAVAGRVPTVFGCIKKFVHLGGNQVFSFFHHFVQCSDASKSLKAAFLRDDDFVD